MSELFCHRNREAIKREIHWDMRLGNFGFSEWIELKFPSRWLPAENNFPSIVMNWISSIYIFKELRMKRKEGLKCLERGNFCCGWRRSESLKELSILFPTSTALESSPLDLLLPLSLPPPSTRSLFFLGPNYFLETRAEKHSDLDPNAPLFKVDWMKSSTAIRFIMWKNLWHAA